MRKPKICAVITHKDIDGIREIGHLVDFFEVRIDMLGAGWEELIPQLPGHWIACNRSSREGGHWYGDETRRVDELIRAGEMGAAIVDIELDTEDLEIAVRRIKKKSKCLISYHDWEKTSSREKLSGIVREELQHGADICKVVTTATNFDDNLTMLSLIREFPAAKVIAFAMGASGIVSRILSPLAGGFLTYASLNAEHVSAPGQVTVEELNSIYRMLAR